MVTATITPHLLNRFPTNSTPFDDPMGLLSFCSGQKSKRRQSSFEKDGTVIVCRAGLSLSTRNRAAEKGQRERKAETVSSERCCGGKSGQRWWLKPSPRTSEVILGKGAAGPGAQEAGRHSKGGPREGFSVQTPACGFLSQEGLRVAPGEN